MLGTGFDLSRIYRLHLSPDADVLKIVQDLSTDPAVEYAEPDYLAYSITTPNDPEYSNQWGLTKINAPAAWDTTTGSSDVAIAVVDAGIDVTHPDLSGQLWQNPGEIAGNGIDDDNNGYIDDIHGWNLVNNNADLSDNTGHGTQVAGIIAATTNNGIGIAGVCWQCRLMVVKVVSSGGVANYSDIAAGVAYAAQKGAKVINLSLGGSSDSVTLKAAIASASSTAVIVGGAGNDNSSAAFYPAAYDDYVLAVAGTTQTDTKVGTSNYGTWVDVSAPGEAIRTTFSGGTYADSSGTSMAAPFVAGLAGLIRSQNPTWSANLTRAQIINTTDNIDGVNPGYEGKLGSGRINAQTGVTTAPIPLFRYVSYTANGTTNAPLQAGATSTIAVTLVNDWKDASSVTATLTTTSSDVTITDASGSWGAIASGQSVANSSNTFQVSVPAGKYGLNIPFTLNILADGVASAVTFNAMMEGAAVTVGGTLASDTTWTNDRIYIANNVTVDTGVTLTIQPGTVIKFNTGKALVVKGTLIADGTLTQPIQFTSNAASPAPGDWGATYNGNTGGIIFASTSIPAQFDSGGIYVSGSIIRNAVVEYSKGLTLQSAAPFIDHNLIRQNSGSDGTVFYNGYGGASQPIISNNRIFSNSGTVVNIQSGHAIVQQNLIANNSGGLYVSDSQTVISNTITGNGGTGSDVSATGYCVICFAFTNSSTRLTGNNIYGNSATYDVAMLVNATQAVNATNNYWGTTDDTAIRARIYDNEDDLNVGTVNFTPFLNAPDPTAPPFLYQLSLNPGSPVGIQQVMFNLNFSAPMDQSINPVAMFYSTKRGTTTTYTKSNTGNGLPDDNINAVAIDGNGNKWFGTSGGVGRFDGTNWTAYKQSNSGLPNDIVESIAVENDRVLWFGTAVGGVARLENSTWTTYTNPSGIPLMDVRAIAVDSAGSKWFGTGFSGVLRFDGTNWTQYNTSNSGLPDNSIRSIAIESNGTKWFGTGGNPGSSNNVARFDGTNWTVYNSSNSSLPDYPVTAIAIDTDGSKWFGTAGGGVARFDGTNWTVYTACSPMPCSGLQSNNIQSIAIASDGTKWFGTGIGLEKFNGSKWTTYFLPTFLSAKVALDGSDNKWLGGYSGAGVLWGGTDYLLNTNAQWLSDTQWRATYDITSLVPRGTYTMNISSAIGTDGMQIPTDTRFGFTVDYAGTISDQTPPYPPSVFATGKPSDVSAVEASWSASDSDSSITGYRYAIGSSAGAVDIVNWTTTSATSLTRNGLGLVAGRQYWIAVQAQNVGGLWSASGNIAFVAGQLSPRLLYLPLILR